MAEALKSTAITNRDATPSVLNTGSLTGASTLKQAIGSVTTTTAGASASTYKFCEVPSNARVSSVVFQAAAMTVGRFDIGVIRNTLDGGGAAFTGGAQFFATNITCATAVATTEIVNQSTTNTIDKQEQPLWQAIGMASDPKTTLDIVATGLTTITAGGLMGVKVTYAQ